MSRLEHLPDSLNEKRGLDVPRERYSMHPGFVSEIPFDAEPIEIITLGGADGIQEDVPLHGSITFADGQPDVNGRGTRFGFSLQDTKIQWFHFDAQGPIPGMTEQVEYEGSRSSAFTPASPFLVSRGFIAPNKDNPQSRLALAVKMVDPDKEGDQLSTLPIIEAKEKTITMEPAKNFYTFLQKKNEAVINQRNSVAGVRSVGKKILAAFGLYAVVHSGGLIDKAIDPFHDAGQAVTQTFQNLDSYHDKSLLRPTDTGQYTYQSPDYWRNAQRSYDESADRVAEVMRDWDVGNMTAIHQKAQAYRERNQEKLMDKEQVANFKERAEAATSNEEVIKVADEFMQFYDKHAYLMTTPDARAFAMIGPFDPKTNVAATKSFTNGLINAFSPLSKDIIGWGKFKDVVLGEGSGDEAGLYIAGPTGENEGKLVFKASVFGGFKSAMSEIQEVVNPDNPEHTILHEFIHGVHLLETGIPKKSGIEKVTSVIKYIGSKAISRPTEASLYAAISANHEKDAENLAIALDVHGKFGLASPNETRRFSSSANQSALIMARDLEQRYEQEGLVAYLVDEQIQNKHRTLMAGK